MSRRAGDAQDLLRVQHVALEAAANAILITDRDGRIQWANPAFSRMTGYSVEEVIGLRPSFLKSGLHDASFYRALWATVIAGDVWHGELTNRRKDGSQYVEEQTIAPVRAPSGEITHFIAIKQDVTERRRVEEALRVAKDAAEMAVRAKSKFLANTSHELRTPLHAVIGLSELLLDSGLTPRQRAMLDTVRESGEALLALIDDLLDLSKLEAGKLEVDPRPVETEPMFAAAMAQVAPRADAKGIELCWSIEPDVPAWILADPVRVSQVVRNLLGNAVKFTDRGEVEARVALRDARGSAPLPGETVRLSVSVRDTGIGIPKERRHLLFQSFSQLESSPTRRFGGSGLGLAISKTLAERMGGGIELESEGVEGRGSCFTFELDAEVVAPGGSAVPPEPRFAGLRVAVLVEQEALLATLSSTLFALGVEAVPCAPDAPLPEGVDAVVADEHQAIAERLDGPPIVWLARMGAVEEPGGREPLFKPVRAPALREALISALDLAPRRDTKPPPEEAPPSMPRARLLVADDSPVGQQVVMAQLTRLGVRADVVSDGVTAIAAIASGSYDLALLDVNMPERGGLEVAEAVRALGGPAAETVLVALTASAMAGDRERCIAAGMDDYLSKPVRLDTLEATLRRALAGRAPRSSRYEPPPVSEVTSFAEVLDRGTIEELRRELGAPAFDEVMATFSENGRVMLAAASEALAAGDLRALHHAVHTLKGSAAACGAPAVARASLDVERLVAARDLGPVASTLSYLGRAFEAFLLELAQLRRST